MVASKQRLQLVSDSGAAAAPLASGQVSPLMGCVFVAPSGDFSGWVASIEHTAKAQGLVVIIDNGSAIVCDPGSTILITASSSRVRCVDATHRVVLMGDLEGAARAGALAIGGALGAGAIHASEAIAEASMINDAVHITAADSGKPSIALWPEFSVSLPVSSFEGFQSPEEAAWANAMLLYRNGPPVVGARARWEPPVFMYDAIRADQRPAAWEIDITGPVRHLVYGPYLTLPAGRWRTTLRFAVDEDAAAIRYRAEWGTRIDHVSKTFSPVQPGVFEISLDYVFTEAAQAELRVVLLQGSLGGSFDFLGAELERTA